MALVNDALVPNWRTLTADDLGIGAQAHAKGGFGSTAPDSPVLTSEHPLVRQADRLARLHGGVISAVLDTTAGLGLMCAIGEHFCDESSEQIMARFLKVGTIDLRIDYAREVLTSMQRVWKRPVEIHTLLDGKNTLLRYDGKEHLQRAIK